MKLTEHKQVNYLGQITAGGDRKVIVSRAGEENYPLPPRLDLRNHFPGFAWGYGGAGPAQLSLAILADYFGQGSSGLVGDLLACTLYHDFKFKLIAALNVETMFEITDLQIRLTIAAVLADSPNWREAISRLLEAEAFDDLCREAGEQVEEAVPPAYAIARQKELFEEYRSFAETMLDQKL